MIDIIKPLIRQFMPFAQERMGFQDPPRLFVRRDEQNAQNPLGKTAYYDPSAKSVTLYITGRHPKDVMRSLSHELVHHTQNCNGEFDNVGEMGDGYAQNDSHLREMERQAYEIGNLCFRDWEDSIKQTIYFEHLQKGVEKVMSTKDWKNGELKSLLAEAWGFNMDLSKLNEAKGGKEPETEEEKELGMKSVKAGRDKNPKISPADKGLEEAEEVFAPNHYCVHHGGVQREGKVEMAEAVNHNYDEELGKVTHYDMQFEDGTIMENVPFEDIQVTNASLAEGHKHPRGMRDEDDKDDKKVKENQIDEMGGCADHGPEDEVVVMQSADDEGPDDPNAIVDELGDLVARLSAALGGAMDRMGDMDDMDDDEEMMDEAADEDDLEERRGRGRNDPRVQRGTPDPRTRPLEEAIRKAIRAALVQKTK